MLIKYKWDKNRYYLEVDMCKNYHKTMEINNQISILVLVSLVEINKDSTNFTSLESMFLSADMKINS